MEFVSKIVKQFGIWLPIVVFVGILVLAIFVLGKIFKGVSGFLSGFRSGIGDTLGDLTDGLIGTDKEQQNRDKQTQDALSKEADDVSKICKPELSEAQISQIAGDCYYALLENNTEDVRLLKDCLMKLKNKADWANLKKAFGTRRDNATFKSFNGTLIQAIREYVHGEDVRTCQEILIRRGVAEL